MAWLRLDDKFDEHPKVLRLGTDGARWTWVQLLLYCSRQGTDLVPAEIGHVLRRVTPRFLVLCEGVGLLDRKNGSYHVHDWDEFNLRFVEDRVSDYLRRNPEATANEVFRSVGGHRKLVLGVVSKMRGGEDA